MKGSWHPWGQYQALPGNEINLKGYCYNHEEQHHIEFSRNRRTESFLPVILLVIGEDGWPALKAPLPYKELDFFIKGENLLPWDQDINLPSVSCFSPGSMLLSCPDYLSCHKGKQSCHWLTSNIVGWQISQTVSGLEVVLTTDTLSWSIPGGRIGSLKKKMCSVLFGCSVPLFSPHMLFQAPEDSFRGLKTEKCGVGATLPTSIPVICYFLKDTLTELLWLDGYPSHPS